MQKENIMKTVEYRILEKSGDYYAQVRARFFSIPVTLWERIGEHQHGYGLYSTLDHPKPTRKDCEILIKEYHRYQKDQLSAKKRTWKYNPETNQYQ